ncbi:MAG: ABC transporter substrate-binding protein [Phycisphaerales bacterium]|jgi:NitT/TauT family transport system substrate-binding protein|nr:ABC transporter substrate-binding protein [Phycisphaerales bacterium]
MARKFTLRRIGIALASTLLASSLVSGCADPGPAENPAGLRTITVQLNWFPEPEFGGFYAAKEQGIFEKAGFDVQLIKGGADVPAPQLVASGRVDFAVISAPQLVTIRARGGKATAVFASFQTAPRAIVVKRGSDFATLKELWESDATVMAQDGLVFIRWLNSIYDGSKLKFVPYAGSSAPFVEGKVGAMQAFATAEPVQLEVDGVMTRVFLVGDTGYNPYDGVVAVNDALLKSEPELVARFTAAVRDGWASYLAQSGPINKVINQLNPDLKPTVLKLAASKLPAFVESDVTRSNGLGWMTDGRWGHLLKQLQAVGEISETEAGSIGRLFVNPSAKSPGGF